MGALIGREMMVMMMTELTNVFSFLVPPPFENRL